MVYLFCLFDAQRGSRRKGGAGGMRTETRAATRPPAMRLRVVSTRAVSRSTKVVGPAVFALRYTFIYLPERRNSRNDTDVCQSLARGDYFLSFSLATLIDIPSFPGSNTSIHLEKHVWTTRSRSYDSLSLDQIPAPGAF